jgi:hypothetical protein
MSAPITENADRDALLRYLDLKTALDDVARKYQDLGIAVVAHAMKAHANEIYACAMLPQRYAPPAVGAPAMSTNPREVVARLVHFVHGDDLTVDSALSPENDAHWAYWRDVEPTGSKAAFTAADAILSTLQPAVTDEAVEAAAKALTQIIWEQSLETVMGRKATTADLVTARARAALTAALPFMMGERT